MRIYYAITPSFCNVTRYVNEGDYERVYCLVMDIVGDVQEAIEASSWCELHCIGDVYEHDDFTIVIIDDV